jgi:hypothetical protein
MHQSKNDHCSSTKFVRRQQINQQPQVQYDAEDPIRTNQPTATTATTTTKFVRRQLIKQRPQVQFDAEDPPHTPINQRPPQLQLNSSDDNQ